MKTNEDILKKLQEQLIEGKSISEKNFDRKLAFRWDAKTEGYLRALDPFGSCITESAYTIWDHAHWFRGNNPKNEDEEEAVLFQRVMALEAILTTKIHLAEPRARRPKGEFFGHTPCPFHTRELEATPNLVFVLMPFTLPWSDRIWRRHIRPAVTQIPLEPSLLCIRADDLAGQDVMIDVYENIVRARIIIADITARNPNVFYELGLAHALGKRVLLITQSVSDIPFDLLRFRHIIYEDNSEGCAKLEAEIQRIVKEIFSSSEGQSNAPDDSA